MSQAKLGRLFLLFLSIVLVLSGFVWFLFQRQARITSLPATHLEQETKQPPSQFDLDRQELAPVQDAATVQAKKDASLYTALKTLRGQVVRYVPGKRSLIVAPTKNKALGGQSVAVSLQELEQVVCWPQYYQAADGSRLDLRTAFITVHPEREEFYWTGQKVWPYAKAEPQLKADRHVLVKLATDLTEKELVATQVVIVGCQW